MKKPTRLLTMRGKIETTSNTAGFTERLTLFDGRFDTGYKVTKFVISTNGLNGGADCIGKLSTESPSNPEDVTWDWGDNTQIAWANNEMAATVTPRMGWAEGSSLVDRDHIIVEDLFITVRVRDITDPFVNYYIELEKYDITNWEGALAMVRNNSQNV